MQFFCEIEINCIKKLNTVSICVKKICEKDASIKDINYNFEIKSVGYSESGHEDSGIVPNPTYIGMSRLLQDAHPAFSSKLIRPLYSTQMVLSLTLI